jgi:hypothetical protein
MWKKIFKTIFLKYLFQDSIKLWAVSHIWEITCNVFTLILLLREVFQEGHHSVQMRVLSLEYVEYVESYVSTHACSIESVFNIIPFCRIWSSHGCGYEEFNHLRYNSSQFTEIQLTFLRDMSPPSSRLKITVNGLHVFMSQKIENFIIAYLT